MKYFTYAFVAFMVTLGVKLLSERFDTVHRLSCNNGYYSSWHYSVKFSDGTSVIYKSFMNMEVLGNYVVPPGVSCEIEKTTKTELGID